jgi:hypothetical protein
MCCDMNEMLVIFFCERYVCILKASAHQDLKGSYELMVRGYTYLDEVNEDTKIEDLFHHGLKVRRCSKQV